MKNVDLTTNVMNKVLRFETHRVRFWLARFLLVLVTLCAAIAVIAFFIARDIGERQTLDLFDIFTRNFETIVDQSQETLSIFWEELPQEAVMVVAVLAGIAILYVLFTRTKRRSIRRKIEQLAKYQHKE